MATVFRRAALTNERDRDLLSEHPEFMELVPPAEEDLVLVADLEGRIVGFATAKTLGDDALEVADIFVDPDHMRSGVGRALIETIVREAIRSGRSVIQVDANRHAVAFYLSPGIPGSPGGAVGVRNSGTDGHDSSSPLTPARWRVS